MALNRASLVLQISFANPRVTLPTISLFLFPLFLSRASSPAFYAHSSRFSGAAFYIPLVRLFSYAPPAIPLLRLLPFLLYAFHFSGAPFLFCAFSHSSGTPFLSRAPYIPLLCLLPYLFCAFSHSSYVPSLVCLSYFASLIIRLLSFSFTRLLPFLFAPSPVFYAFYFSGAPFLFCASYHSYFVPFPMHFSPFDLSHSSHAPPFILRSCPFFWCIFIILRLLPFLFCASPTGLLRPVPFFRASSLSDSPRSERG